MRVRIHFRGLVLFRFPTTGDDKGKLVAELISDPQRSQHPGGPHEHRPRIQQITAEGMRTLVQQGLDDKTRVNLSVQGGPPVSRSESFNAYVPKLSEIVARGTTDAVRGMRKRPRDERAFAHVRNTITVDRGQIRVKDVVIWDAGGFSLSDATARGDLPSVPTKLKFVGSEGIGHMANECVIDIPDVDRLAFDSLEQPNIKDVYRAADHRPNRPSGFDAFEILITNYESQRVKPTPWGMDFQWLFGAAAYDTADLSGTDFNRFMTLADKYDSDLLAEDWRELMDETLVGTPFPYVPSESAYSRLSPITNDIDSRPVCVPGHDDGFGR